LFYNIIYTIQLKKTIEFEDSDQDAASLQEQKLKTLQEASQSKAIWQIGISQKAIAVAEDGALIAFEFSPEARLPTAEDIVKAVESAIASPFDGKNARKPALAMVRESCERLYCFKYNIFS
jgi:hypothetical protein